MSSYLSVRFGAAFTPIAVALVLVIGFGVSSGARADNHYFSLKKIFPNGKCSPVIPNYERMVAGFAGGEVTRYRIHDDQGAVFEIISTFINKDRNQWAMVGLKTESKVIFCLYASGVGKGSVENRTIESE